jgi:predicted O-methyltransferase YrrM
MPRCAETLEAEMTPAEHELLQRMLMAARGEGDYLEIGTAAGGTLCTMLAAFPVEKRPPFVVVDPMGYFPNQLELVHKNLRDHQLDPANVDFRVATSAQAFPAAASRNDRFRFQLIDGCHKIRSVMLDLKWTRLLAVGGVVCFHDFTPKHRGVWLAVRRFLAKNPNYQIIEQADSLLAVRKREPSPLLEVTTTDEWYASAWYLPLQLERKWQKLRRAA